MLIWKTMLEGHLPCTVPPSLPVKTFLATIITILEVGTKVQNCELYPQYSFILIFILFDKGSQVPRMALTSLCSPDKPLLSPYLSLPDIGITSLCHRHCFKGFVCLFLKNKFHSSFCECIVVQRNKMK